MQIQGRALPILCTNTVLIPRTRGIPRASTCVNRAPCARRPAAVLYTGTVNAKLFLQQ